MLPSALGRLLLKPSKRPDNSWLNLLLETRCPPSAPPPPTIPVVPNKSEHTDIWWLVHRRAAKWSLLCKICFCFNWGYMLPCDRLDETLSAVLTLRLRYNFPKTRKMIMSNLWQFGPVLSNMVAITHMWLPALQMQLIPAEMCCDGISHTKFWKHSAEKIVKYLINIFMLIACWNVNMLDISH